MAAVVEGLGADRERLLSNLRGGGGIPGGVMAEPAYILLADAEIEIAKKLETAVAIYAKNEPAMKLNILSIWNEGLKAGNSMMLVPNSITEELKAKDIFGLEALTELRKKSEEGGKS
jgi:adenylosuccinate lyase